MGPLVARAVETVVLNEDQVESGKIIICAAAANAALANSPQADDILTSCLMAVKATDRTAAAPTAGPPATAPGTPAPSGNGQGLASFDSRVAKQAFAGLEKNYNISRDQFAQMMRSPNASSSLITMLQDKLSPDQFARAQNVIARTEATAEKKKEDPNNQYNLGAPIRNNDIKELRAALKERMDKLGGFRNRSRGLRRLPPRVAASPPPAAAKKLADEQLTPAEESLFTQPAAAPEEPMVELTLFDVVKRKYREKFEMMASPMITGPIHTPAKQ